MIDRCRHCGQKLETLSGRYGPFCSERCRLLDLGAWTTERYRIAGPAVNDEAQVPSRSRDQSEE